MKHRKMLAALTVTYVVIGGVSQAQVSDTEVFRVTVPLTMTITAPPLVAITHDETDNNQVFAPQRWQVRSNAVLGATVTFSTNQAFTHTAIATFKRDARLDLAIASSDPLALWNVTVPSDQTNYGGGDEIAIVEAASLLPGDADFDLTVTFLTVDYSTLVAGDYELTVTGTLTANP